MESLLKSTSASGRILYTPLCDAIFEAYSKQKLFVTASRGILNLIPKQNKDSRKLANLRPITLLNTDYKIIEKALANRLIPMFEDIIHTDQKGFLPGRKITHNIRKIMDLISHTKTRRYPCSYTTD